MFKSTTRELGVGNVGFLIERHFAEITPQQFVREYQVNALQAIERAQHNGLVAQGQVVWDRDENTYQKKNLTKLCIIDNGDGMNSDELIKFIGEISSGKNGQNLDGNFGIGAKISGYPLNPLGVVYQSWQNGNGVQLHIWRDPDTNKYGMRQYQQIGPNDEVYTDYISQLDQHFKPAIIDQHGTKVIFLGDSLEQDTTEGSGRGKDTWLIKCLNSRFFKFPENVTTKVREKRINEPDTYREIQGQERLLARDSVMSGVLHLTQSNLPAIVRWWILKDQNRDGRYNSTGHMAALYDNELYDLAPSIQTERVRLQSFGVMMGAERDVVIYIEPDQQLVISNSGRTHLLFEKEHLPWGDWAVEFLTQMPQAIKDLVASKSNHLRNNSKSVHELLKPYMHLYSLHGVKPDPNQPSHHTTTATGSGPSTSTTTGTCRGGGGGGGNGHPNRRKSLIEDVYESGPIANGKKVNYTDLPQTIWVSVADGTRDPDDLVDRAARYIPTKNLIMINTDFAVFQNEIARWVDGAKAINKPVPTESIVQIVHKYVELALVDAVMGAMSLRYSQGWGTPAILAALSDEALTVVASARYWLNFGVSREIPSHFGTFEPMTPTAAAPLL